ncbi:MAG: lipid asymmetry maintenance protein MlaB [Steroidobacteraceae bacterium]
MSNATLVQQGEGRYLVNGELSFATVTDLLRQSQGLFAGESSLQLDLSGVTHADSAGLSLLIEWLRQARLQGKQLRYLALPAQLQALANISEVSGLLSQSV